MEQNNANFQNESQRDPLPVFGNQPQNNYAQQNASFGDREPLPTFDYSTQPPVYTQTANQGQGSSSDVDVCAGEAFGKSLAAAIMAWFPVCSIIAIIFGSIGIKMARRSDELAAHYGVGTSGKAIAAKILGKIGNIGGIVMTAIYSIYFIVIILALGSL